jgi:hypothetical protein
VREKGVEYCWWKKMNVRGEGEIMFDLYNFVIHYCFGIQLSHKLGSNYIPEFNLIVLVKKRIVSSKF